MDADDTLNTDTTNEGKLVRPTVEFCSLLKHAGATKEIFTMKELMYYLGQYIIQKQLYDQKQQHMVHCAQDALGRVLGIDSFSIKEPRVLFAMITKNLVTVKNQDSASNSSEGLGSWTDERTEERTQVAETEAQSSSPDRRRRRRRSSSRSNEPGPSHSREEGEEEELEEDEEVRKRRRSDSYSLTFDDSLSWCVIGGLGSGRDTRSCQSSDSHSTSERSEDTVAGLESDNDNFSVEFEVESIDSDDYGEDDASVSASVSTDDEVYELTIYEAEDDSFDEDTEITEADYWHCLKCDGMNPPLPRNCQHCWTLRQNWLPEASVNSKVLPTKSCAQSAAKETSGSDIEENEGVDVPDGKGLKSPSNSQTESQDLLSQPSSSSKETLGSSESQPLSSDSQELLPSPSSQPKSVPDRLPNSCLDPCLICQSQQKNGLIVHGQTGHLMSCYTCARKLKRRNKLCPVCRLPIQAVIMTYFS
uniref:Transformed 3T3 cell double minute 2 homolog n=1 Tax=Nothobranchius pienaari TaxID=704102 RepID=A0A1A8LH54_9TELE